MLDVCLVSMPYAVTSSPLLSVGLLLAEAKEAGLRAKSVYPVFWFAEKIGMHHYSILSELSVPEDLLGEWTFAGAAFPDHQPDHDAFLAPRLAKVRPLLRDVADVRERIWEIRRQAEEFIAETAEKILALEPRILGCSSTFQQHVASLALCRKVKALKPDVVTMLGGGNCTGAMGLATQRSFPWVDYVVSGEADEVFVRLCRSVLENGDRGRTPGASPPVTAKSVALDIEGAHGFWAPVIAAPAVARMDSLPTPDFDDYFEQLEVFPYKDFIRPGLPVETSRGCWWGQKDRCTFCGLFDTIIQYRSKSPARVLDEHRTLAEKYSLTKFAWTDLILDVKYFKTLLPELATANGSPYSICLEVKANLTEEQVELLAQAGARWIQPGIESLSDEILKAMHKGNTTMGNVALLKYTAESGIWVIWQMLAAVPGEQDEWYQKMNAWLPLVVHLQPPAQVLEIRYDRFAPYYEEQGKFGLSLTANPSYAGVYPLGAEELDELAYFFVDRRSPNGLAKGPGLAQMETLVKQWRRLRIRPPAGGVPVLTMHDDGTRTTITDTRPCAVEKETVLEGLSRLVHQACRRPRSRDAMRREIETKVQAEVPREPFDAAVDLLVSQKLLLSLDGLLLALATHEPRRPLLPIVDVPSGFNYALSNVEAARRRQMALTLASILGS